MKVQILVSMGGQGGAWPANNGDVRDLDDAEAQRLIAAGYAAPLKEGASTRETATIEAPETAGGGKRRGKARE